MEVLVEVVLLWELKVLLLDEELPELDLLERLEVFES